MSWSCSFCVRHPRIGKSAAAIHHLLRLIACYLAALTLILLIRPSHGAACQMSYSDVIAWPMEWPLDTAKCSIQQKSVIVFCPKWNYAQVV